MHDRDRMAKRAAEARLIAGLLLVITGLSLALGVTVWVLQ